MVNRDWACNLACCHAIEYIQNILVVSYRDFLFQIFDQLDSYFSQFVSSKYVRSGPSKPQAPSLTLVERSGSLKV